ncbi:hypothetical protein B0I73DRAFT_149547 [Yarrowia lipolytica]|nr:hypothetical protein B0I73DRAFT_149547 [Yarrowia lipolytica]
MKIINMLSLGGNTLTGNTLTGNTLTGNTLTGNTSTASHFSSLILAHFLNNIPSSNSAHLRALLIFGLCSSSGSIFLLLSSSSPGIPPTSITKTNTYMFRLDAINILFWNAEGDCRLQ